jgi:zinc/manganese transport system permease protein
MFSGFMENTWIVGTVVALVAGPVGFFVILRGNAFMAHAIPNSSFAGAAGATLLGINTLFGLGVFALLGSLGIGLLGKRGRGDVITALILSFFLGLGALFLSLTSEYSSEVYSLLFGQVLGISPSQLAPTLAMGAVVVLSLALLFRPLMLATLLPDVAAARRINLLVLDISFLTIVALTTTFTVPVVGTLLVFSLMIGAPASARTLTNRPGVTIILSALVGVLIMWSALAMSYKTNLPVGFFVGTLSAGIYTVAKVCPAYRE